MTGNAGATIQHRDEIDADAPLSDEEFERGRGAMLARQARTATGLSQAAFARAYGIPTASLQDWEQGRRTPDAAASAYLRVIARLPDEVAKALAGGWSASTEG